MIVRPVIWSAIRQSDLVHIHSLFISWHHVWVCEYSKRRIRWLHPSHSSLLSLSPTHSPNLFVLAALSSLPVSAYIYSFSLSCCFMLYILGNLNFLPLLEVQFHTDLLINKTQTNNLPSLTSVANSYHLNPYPSSSTVDTDKRHTFFDWSKFFNSQ